MTQIFSKNLFRQFSIFIKYFGKNFENKKQKMSQLCGFIKDKKEDLLEKYLISLRPSGIVTVEQLEEYKEAQRDLTDHMNLKLWMLKSRQKIETPTFIMVKIEHISSVREFYVTQICHLEMRKTFQNRLNQTYEVNCEPINDLKEKDLCVVFYDSDWCRAEVIDIISEKNEDSQITVYLVDYGRTVCTDRSKMCMLKQPHDSTAPFVIKCYLSVNTDDNALRDSKKNKLFKKFTNFSKDNDRVLIYMNGLVPEKPEFYDVILLTNAEVKVVTSNSAFLLHEAYAAFIYSPILFDTEISEKWSKIILEIFNDKPLDSTNKTAPVFLSYIESPNEVYVKCSAAQALMNKIRHLIDAYVNKYGITIKDKWSIGEDCLVRVQNWKTGSNLKQWYRGRIIDYHPEGNLYDVFLRDYGRKTKTDNTDLIPISYQLVTPSDAVQKCRLDISNVWPESGTNLVLQTVEEYRKFAITCNSKDEDGCLAVTLWATNLSVSIKDIEKWDNVGLSIICQSVVQSIQTFITKSQRYYSKKMLKRRNNQAVDSDMSQYSEDYNLLKNISDKISNTLTKSFSEITVAEEDDSHDNILFQESIIHNWLPALPIQSVAFFGFVTHITDKGIIYAQEESNNEAAYELGQLLTHHIKNEKHADKKSHVWKEGEACFAGYSRDGYQRAIVKKINPEDGTCLIHFVDYGDGALLRLDDLYPATKFGDIPILVHRFYIPKIVALDKNGIWPKPIFNVFKAKMINEMCVICLDNLAITQQSNNSVLPCSIEPRNLPCDIYIWLLKKKLGLGTDINSNGEEILYV